MAEGSISRPRPKKVPPQASIERASEKLSKVESKRLHRQYAADWIVQHLSRKYAVRPSKVQMSHRLKDWGYTDERGLAALAAEFNQDTENHPVWGNTDVAPPDLISKVGVEGRLSDFASFLGDEAVSSSSFSASGPNEPAIESFLYSEFSKLHPGISASATLFGSDALKVAESEAVAVASAFRNAYGISIYNLLVDAVGHKNPTYTIHLAAIYVYQRISGSVSS